MDYFRMKLNPKNCAGFILHRIQRIISQRCQSKAGRNFSDVIAVTHPYVHLFRQARKETTGNVQYLETRITKFAIGRRNNFASKFLRKDLKAITNPKLRTVNRIQNFFVGLRGCRVINRRWPARKDQTFRRTRVDCFNRSAKRQDLTIHSSLTNATSNQLSVLRSEVKYYYGFVQAGVGQANLRVQFWIKCRTESCKLYFRITRTPTVARIWIVNRKMANVLKQK